MRLLADGGSTSVDWRLIDNGKEILRTSTKGANPFFRTTEDISEEIGKYLIPRINGSDISSVHFFGAGCAFPEKNEIIRQAIAKHLSQVDIEVDSDLLAAARGLCGHEKGIACIIGTGSNSCFYDGNKIVDNVSPLGYILGDEGSGAVLGRLFIGACLKNQLTSGLKEKMLAEMGLTPSEILDRVYRQPLANRFLASFSPFMNKHIEDKSVYDLVFNAFRDFFTKNVMQYDYKNNLVHFTGSVAYAYAAVLRDVARSLDIEVGTITASPMEGLIKYYS
ncbi:BadF/BadG/BcrA/BcrD ATPase family protein [Dysgonomonas sp. 511]|uniref:BadF/BadG/BcrA/BcrD ATPase family protein n=1 Tax=Dysgonomonas sp. 511 TaxID=2302930 RepID=UPI0013CFB60D|nr:BadF/BadG/BcrA/BcrD ATPase family protein [Dysgonomonas sp. 511]NDV78107.1 ATPase [Dysgonomonas sp. 511]